MQFSSAAFVHLAVAVAPTFKQMIDAKAGEKAKTARVTDKSSYMVAVKLESVNDGLQKSSDLRLKSSLIPNQRVLLPR